MLIATVMVLPAVEGGLTIPSSLAAPDIVKGMRASLLLTGACGRSAPASANCHKESCLCPVLAVGCSESLHQFTGNRSAAAKYKDAGNLPLYSKLASRLYLARLASDGE